MIPERSLVAGRYRILRRLGAGAMGAVYEALDLETERRRALKVMHAHIVDRSDLRERFRLEARVTGRIQSPFLVDVLDAGIDDTGAPFLVMELLHGEDLRQRLDRVGRFSPAEALGYLDQAARALDRIHQAGVVHRDLKPGNLFLEEREHEPPRIKVLDFGIAKLISGTASGEATSNMGTPTYMAPEQLRGGPVTAAADLHALGLLAFTFLVGAAYWDEDKQRAGDVLAFALVAMAGPQERAGARAARLGVELPPGFDAWFARATAADPDRRFGSAFAAVCALAEALGLPAPTPDTSLEAPAAGLAPATGTDASAVTHERNAALTATRTEPAAGPAVTAPDPTAMAHAAPLVRRRSRLGRALLVLGTAAVVAGSIRLAGALRAGPRSPLAAPASVLACPIFAASGVDEPAGWLGAAAAGIFCERARIVLGGEPARTLVAPELLGLPAQPIDRFPEDPYAAPEARARSIEAARRRAAAYVDGQVARDGSGFRVAVAVCRPDGAVIDRAEGRGRALYEAVRAAMEGLVQRGALPEAPALDPTVAAFSRAHEVGGALALLDLSLAMANNAGGLAGECARVAARSAGLAEQGPGERFRCAYTLGLPTPQVVLPPADPASPGAFAARARVEHMVHHADDPEIAAELARLFQREATPWGRSVLAATASCLVQAADPQRAAELALLAVQAEPKNSTGEFCAPWIQLAYVTSGTASTGPALRAMQAWEPWEGYGWLFQAKLPGDPARSLAYHRRAYLLSPFDTYVADELGGRLLASGAREEARGIALALSSGSYPVHRLEADLLLVRIEASEARFGAALARAMRAMVVDPGDAGWVRVQRLEIAWRALQIALVLGRAPAIADLITGRFLDPEPPPLDGAHLDVLLRLTAVCAYASPEVAPRCFTRFRALRGQLSGGILPDTDAFTEGAERYARGDFAAAARAFRPLVRQPGPFVEVLAEAMIETFERTGERDLVARLEAAIADRTAELNGASLAVVRAARRAAVAGDHAKARELARRVVDAWSVADEPVPVLAEMRQLAAPRPGER